MNTAPLTSRRGLAALLGAALLLSGAAWAQNTAPAATPVSVEGAWARATVQGQKSSGAFMKLTARGTALRLVGVSTPVAGVAEIHEMKMDGDVMKMRALDGLDLPAGQPVELKPGGYHVMLMDLKAPLAQGASVPLTLRFKDAKGADSQAVVQVPVATSAPGGASGMAMPMDHGAHKH